MRIARTARGEITNVAAVTSRDERHAVAIRHASTSSPAQAAGGVTGSRYPTWSRARGPRHGTRLGVPSPSRPRLSAPMALEDRTRYDPGESEARVFARWFESGRFHPEPAGTAAENYSIAIPPPNVTGALHMGHALNGSIQDTLIRYARMRGKRTKWILGTDHAGIATQTQVERLLASEGTSPRGDRPRGVRRARVALARAVRLRRSSTSTSGSARRATTPRSASRSTRRTCARS